jgi:hypothetical protein
MEGTFFLFPDLYTGARLLKYVWMMSVSHAFCVLLLVSLSYVSLSAHHHRVYFCISHFFCYRITHSLCENFPLWVASALPASSSAPHISSHRSFIDLTSFYSFLISLSLFRGGGSPSFHLPSSTPPVGLSTLSLSLPVHSSYFTFSIRDAHSLCVTVPLRCRLFASRK